MVRGYHEEPFYLDEVPPLRGIYDSIVGTLDDLTEKWVSRNAELNKMRYKDFLETPEWRETRQAVLRRAGRRCERCGTWGLLHVHHRTYARRGYEDLDDLEAVCADCHAKEHGK